MANLTCAKTLLSLKILWPGLQLVYKTERLPLGKRLVIYNAISRNSHQRCSMKKGVLWNFTEFTVKHLCQSLSFHKVAELRPVTLLNKRIWHRCFPVNFTRFLKTSFLKENLRWLLLPFPLIPKDFPFSKIFPEILAWLYNLYTIYHYRL